MKIENGNIVNTIQKFLKQHSKVEVADEEVSSVLRNLNFSQTLELIDNIKDANIEAVADVLGIGLDDVDEAYGTVGTQQPSASTIKATNKKIATADRRDRLASKPSAVVQRAPAAGSAKVKTGGPQGYVPPTADPDDVQRADNQAGVMGNANDIDRLENEVARLKSLSGIK